LDGFRRIFAYRENAILMTTSTGAKLISVTYKPGPHAPGVGPERLEQLRKLAERFD
jgi:hypothetical protein